MVRIEINLFGAGGFYGLLRQRLLMQREINLKDARLRCNCYGNITGLRRCFAGRAEKTKADEKTLSPALPTLLFQKNDTYFFFFFAATFFFATFFAAFFFAATTAPPLV